MFRYYLDLALSSLRRNPILTGLMVLAIALGIGASMTMITVLHVMTDDPLPLRSAHLYTPHLDPLPLNHSRGSNGADPADNLTWPDAMALLQSKHGVRQAAMAGGTMLVRPEQAGLQPFYAGGRYATADIFALFGMRFEYGGGWSAEDDAAGAHVAVLSDTMARKLFGRANAVGRAAHLGEQDYRVIGVVADWAPAPQFYADNTGSQYSDVDTYFLPLSVAVANDLPVSGNQSGWGRDEGQSGKRGAAESWLQYWVQLDTPTQVAAYRQYLVNYSAQQKALGRFERPPTNAALYSLMGWLAHQNLVPNDVQLQLWLALGFLFVCMLNIVALLLAKFLRRGGEISVRRALGAGRRDIFLQLGVESALIGLAGGVLGLVIAQVGLWSVRHRQDDYARLAQMDPWMLAGTFALAVFASVLAGLLPAWRACRIAPALQLKAQ